MITFKAYLDLTDNVNESIKDLDESFEISNLLLETHVVGSYSLERLEGTYDESYYNFTTIDKS